LNDIQTLFTYVIFFSVAGSPLSQDCCGLLQGQLYLWYW